MKLSLVPCAALLSLTSSVALGSSEIRHAEAFRHLSPSTGGIQAAIDAFGPAPKCGELRLPPGITDITETIVIADRWGCRIVGHGKNESGYDSTSGSKLRWKGAAGGTVLDVSGTQNSIFKGFMIFGWVSDECGAGTGIRYRPSDSGTSSFDNHFSEIGITWITGSPGIAIHIGQDGATTQADHSTFEKIFVSHTAVGIQQEGSQTVINSYRDIRFSDITRYGMDFRSGDVFVERCDFGTYLSSGAIADINVEPGAHWATFIGNYHESRAGVPYRFPVGQRIFPTTMTGVHIVAFQAGQRFVDYRQSGPVNITGTSFMRGADTPPICGGANPVCEVHIDGQYGASTVPVSSTGNLFAAGTFLTVTGSAFLAGDNNSGSGSSDAINSLGVMRLKSVALALEGGALLWRRGTDGLSIFKQYVDGAGFMYWVNQTNTKFAALYGNVTPESELPTNAYTFRIGKLRGDAEVRSDVVVKAPLIDATTQVRVGGASGPTITTGAGVASSCPVDGSLYMRTDTPPGLYVCSGGAWQLVVIQPQ